MYMDQYHMKPQIVTKHLVVEMHLTIVLHYLVERVE